jgi:hypothetical protein
MTNPLVMTSVDWKKMIEQYVKPAEPLVWPNLKLKVIT